jgi:hypothetical protein
MEHIIIEKLLTYNNFKDISNDDCKKIIDHYQDLITTYYTNRILNDKIQDNDDYIYKYNVILLRYWQEFYCLFYLSLYIIKTYYKSNSYIISLGESPSKIVFSQSLFYQDTDIKSFIKLNGYPDNLDFIYFPISNLHKIINDDYDYSDDYSDYDDYDYNDDDILLTLNVQDIYTKINTKLSEDIMNKYFIHFKKFNLDPLYIINNDKNFTFIDKTETFKSFFILLVIYKRMIELQHVTNEQKLIFINKFKCVGYNDDYYKDYKYKILEFINLLYTTDKAELMFDHYIINLNIDTPKYNNIIKIIESYNAINESYFIYNYIIFYNIIKLSSPAKYLDINLRCIQKYDIKETKDNIINYVNCNLINFIIYYVFKKLKESKKLQEFIKKLDSVDVKYLSILNDNNIIINDDINKFLYYNENGMDVNNDDVLFNYIHNIFSNTDNTIFNFDTIIFEVKYNFTLDIILSSNKLLTYNNFKEISSENYKEIVTYYQELIKTSYINKLSKNELSKNDSLNKYNVILLRYWQEFYCLFYLSLYIIKKYYKSNSYIISIGESPSKIVFSQSLFYQDTNIKSFIKSNGYPDNLDFIYFPISNLYKLININTIPEIIELDVKIIYSIINQNLTEEIINKFLIHFKNFNLDPLFIVNNNKNFIFIDRSEILTTCLVFLVIYKKMVELQKLSCLQQHIFLNKFKFVGYNMTDSIDIFKDYKQKYKDKIIEFINFLYNYTKEYTINMFDYYIIDINDSIQKYNDIKKDLINKKIIQHNIFIHNYIILYNIISFTSTPEKNYINSRCIKSFNVQNSIIDKKIDIKEDTYATLNSIYEEKKHKQPPELLDKFIKDYYDFRTGSDHCNLINFIIYYVFMKLNDVGKIEELIKKIDDINFKDLSILNSEYITIDDNIKKFTDTNDMAYLENYVNAIFKNTINTIFNFDKIEFNVQYKEYKQKYLKYKIKYINYKLK